MIVIHVCPFTSLRILPAIHFSSEILSILIEERLPSILFINEPARFSSLIKCLEFGPFAPIIIGSRKKGVSSRLCLKSDS